MKEKKKVLFSELIQDLGEESLGRFKEGGTASVFAEQIFGLLLDGLGHGGRSLAEVEENQAAFEDVRVRIRLKGETRSRHYLSPADGTFNDFVQLVLRRTLTAAGTSVSCFCRSDILDDSVNRVSWFSRLQDRKQMNWT